MNTYIPPITAEPFLCVYQSALLGFHFEPGAPMDGRPSLIGSSPDFSNIIHLVGDPDNLTHLSYTAHLQYGENRQVVMLSIWGFANMVDIAPNTAILPWVRVALDTHGMGVEFTERVEAYGRAYTLRNVYATEGIAFFNRGGAGMKISMKELTVARRKCLQDLSAAITPPIQVQLEQLNSTAFLDVPHEELAALAERVASLMAFFGDITAKEIKAMGMFEFHAVLDYTRYRVVNLSDGEALALLEWMGRPLSNDEMVRWFFPPQRRTP